jgi:hypothetical protein
MKFSLNSLWQLSTVLLLAQLIHISGAIAQELQDLTVESHQNNIEVENNTPIAEEFEQPSEQDIASSSTKLTIAALPTASSQPDAELTPTNTVNSVSPISTPKLIASTPDSRATYDDPLLRLESEDDAMSQVTSVSQFSDVQPTDWAFQALQSLVERYGCIAGYPDGTFKGNRPLTRYEFAAGVNACLDRVNELIAAGTTGLATKEDLATLQKLQEDFAAELATLRGRTDTLEARTSELEANQFSTTSKLEGETIFSIISILDGDRATGEEADRVPTFGYRVRLNLQTSFTGKDLLTTRLQVGNVIPLGSTTSTGVGFGPLATNEGRVEFDGDSGGDIGLALLRYRFPLGPRTNIYIAAAGNGFVDLDASQQLNPYFDGGAVSLFALRNPIYNYTFGAGLGIRHFFNDNIELNLGYLVPESIASNPLQKEGLFNGKYGALAQLIYNFGGNTRIGLTYINSYTPFPARLQPEDAFTFGATGSNLANSNFGTAVSANAYGVSGTIQFSPNMALSGWVGYVNQRYIGKGDGSVWNWAVGLAFPDVGTQGSLIGLFVGMEPKLTSIDSTVSLEDDEDTSLHLEAFYRYRLNDNIAITPGLIWLTAPNHDADNDDAFIGVVRTVFYF